MTAIASGRQAAPTAPTHIDALLDAIRSGTGIPTTLYSDDAVLDATVPNWRFQATGPEAISATYTGWFAQPGRFDEFERWPMAGGEALAYLLVWEEDGVPFAAHHAHLITLDDAGRILHDRVWCGGRWSAALLAEMAAAAQ